MWVAAAPPKDIAHGERKTAAHGTARGFFWPKILMARSLRTIPWYQYSRVSCPFYRAFYKLYSLKQSWRTAGSSHHTMGHVWWVWWSWSPFMVHLQPQGPRLQPLKQAEDQQRTVWETALIGQWSDLMSQVTGSWDRLYPKTGIICPRLQNIYKNIYINLYIFKYLS